MDKNTITPIDPDDLSIRIKFDGESDDNYAQAIHDHLHEIPDLAAWLDNPDSIAKVELWQVNANDDWRYDADKYNRCDIWITHTDGRSWEGEAEA